jgi:VanZ family protein
MSKGVAGTLSAAYCLALLLLLLVPISHGVAEHVLGAHGDKWAHILLFAGMAWLLRLSLDGARRASIKVVLAALVLALLTEAFQWLTGYRHAEWMDVVADMLGALIGTLAAASLLARPGWRRAVAFTAMPLGLGLALGFGSADLTGLGASPEFGRTQLMGVLVGAIIAIGGAGGFLARRPGESGLA